MKIIFYLFLVIFLFTLHFNAQLTLNPSVINDIEEQNIVDQDINKTRVIFKQVGQWSNIQKQQDNFYWQQADSAFNLATTNNFIVQWDLQVSPQSEPQWIKNLTQQQKKSRMINFIRKICKRYQNYSIFSLQVIDQNQGNDLAYEISKICINKKIQIKSTNTNNIIRRLYSIQYDYNTNQHLNQNSQINQNHQSVKSDIRENSRLLLNSPPVASLSQVSLIGYTLNVLSTSTDPDAQDQITQIQWDWGDCLSDCTYGTSLNDVHIYQSAGSYVVKLKVKDNNGAWSQIATLNVVVPTSKPSAMFTTQIKKQNVNFDGRGSSATYAALNTWSWTFGDGQQQTKSTGLVSHVYPQTQSYTASLIVTDSKGASSQPFTSTFNINKNVLPTASFNVLSIVGYSINVESNSTDSDGFVLGYDFDFGDGKTHGFTKVSSHIYDPTDDDPRTYTIILKAIDDNGGFSTTSKQVTIPSNLPVVRFSSTVNKLTVTFDASNSSSVLGLITKYSWDFGDSSAIQNTTSKTITYTYSSAGQKTVTLKIYDDKNLENSLVQKVTPVANAKPTADFTYSRVGKSVTVVSSSSDSDGQIAGYQWAFGDNTPNSTTSTVTHTYTLSGTFYITLKVTDNNGAQSQPKVIQVRINDPPITSLSAAVLGYQVTITSSASDPDGGIIASNQFQWGDSSSTTSGQNPIHDYANAGLYTITYVSTDDDGLFTTKTASVIVPGEGPVARFTATTDKMVVNVDASTSSFTSATINNYIWDWGNGLSQTTSSPTVSHTYQKPDIYFITLKVSDNKGAVSKAVQKIVSIYRQDNRQNVGCWRWQYLMTREIINSGDNLLYVSRASTYDGTIVKNHFFGKSSISL